MTIASILVLHPQVLILDEPTAGQDYRHYTEIMEFLKKLNEEYGITIIMITHDMHLMLEYTNRAVVIADGRLLADTGPAAVLTDDAVANRAYLKKTSLRSGGALRHCRADTVRGALYRLRAADESGGKRGGSIMSRVLSYEEKDTWIHRLSGVTKLLFFLLWSITSMISYDTRVLLVALVCSLIIFAISEDEVEAGRYGIQVHHVFLVINLIAIFFFSPGQGTKIYGTETPIVHLFGHYTLTKEQLFYEFNVMVKYLTVIPAVFMFIVWQRIRANLAASLNRVGVSYKDRLLRGECAPVYSGCRMILQGKRPGGEGIEMSGKAKLGDRIKNVAAIIFPLVFSSMDRIDVVSNAMELRGFGKHKKRTWYMGKPLAAADYAVLIVTAAFSAVALMITFSNGSRFYNPFV